MIEYINREAALEIVEMYRWGKHLDRNSSLNAVRDGIRNIPRSDVAPMKHGRWEFYSSHGEDEYEYKCSECEDWANQRYSYCPNCGAKMNT